jgi:hypothetical protein
MMSVEGVMEEITTTELLFEAVRDSVTLKVRAFAAKV